MQHSLQKVSQDPSQFIYDQQKMLQELKAMQQENFKLQRNVQELEGRIAYLMSNTSILKNENSQPVNLRFEQMGVNFNQLAELTERLFLKNTTTNDPMDVEPNTQPAKIPIVINRKQCWYCRKYGHIQDIAENSYKIKV